MRKKIGFIFVLLLCVAFTLFAANVESLLEKAKANSSVYQGYEINHQNTLISQEQNDLNGVEVSVTGGYSYIPANGSIASTSAIRPTTITVSVPDLYNDIGLSFETEIGPINTKKSDSVTVSPELAISKDFDVKNYVDTRDDLADEISDLQTEINYKTNVCNFENSLYNDIVSIMQSEENIKSLKTTYERSLHSYETSIKVGSIEKNSLTDIEQQMKLTSSKASLDSAVTKYNKSLDSFVNNYGIEFETITEVRDANLNFTPSENGNSKVKVAYNNLESAKQDLNAELGYTSTLSLGASASSTLQTKSNEKFSGVTLGASVAYKTGSRNYVSVTLEDTLKSGSSMVPSVTVLGSWSSNTTNSKDDSLTIQKLQNAVLSAETNYNNALFEYKTNAQTLQKNIETHLSDVEDLKIKTDYHKAILDYQTKLYELGMATSQNLEDAQTNYDNDLIQATILKLQALVLENNIKTIEL